MTTDTTTHDFKAALENFKNYAPHYDLYDSTEESICHALRIADALMQEPTKRMILAGLSYYHQNDCKFEKLFKVMRDQMIRELEE